MSSNDQIEIVVFKPGEFLFHENEQSFHFYIIQSGKVEVFKTGENGKRLPLAIVNEGTSIGEFAMIDRLPRSASARAVTEVHAARVSDEAYNQLLQDLPDWAVSVMKTLVDRLRQTNEIIRRHQIIDDKVREKIQSVEFDDSGTITESNPFLRNSSALDDDDSPMLGEDDKKR